MVRTPDPEEFVIGAHGPVVILSGRVCRMLDYRVLARWRQQVRGQDAELDAALYAITAVGTRWAAQRSTSHDGTAEVPIVEAEPPLIHELLDTKEVAGRLGVSDRYVRMLAGGLLPAKHRKGRAYLFDPEDVAEYIERRAG